MLLLGIDLGTSSIKISVVDAASRQLITSVRYPEEETSIKATQPGYAEQDPNLWWQHIQEGILKANATGKYNPKDIEHIGIAYQMHGLVVLDQQGQVIRDSIIWCDSRAVEIGQQAFEELGRDDLLKSHLNSPGNFTASKLKWVQLHEPENYKRIKYVMLPGDFVSFRLTGEANTSISALSEGILWDFEKAEVSSKILDYYHIDKKVIPEVHEVFENHGTVTPEIAQDLGISPQATVTYKAGDQPNNALSLNVLQPGEVAATAGTSGVIYGVSDQLIFDEESRINTFAHVNYTQEETRTGVLLCINGTGILNQWIKKNVGQNIDYAEINEIAQTADLGSDGLRILPFGNGAERMLNDRIIQAQICNLDLNRHQKAEIFRASQEGIAFAFRYGLDIMRQNGMNPKTIKAGHANLFLSPLFASAFVGATQTALELYNNDGSMGAALGAGIGAQLYNSTAEAFEKLECIKSFEPDQHTKDEYETIYQDWKNILTQKLNH